MNEFKVEKQNKALKRKYKIKPCVVVLHKIKYTDFIKVSPPKNVSKRSSGLRSAKQKAKNSKKFQIRRKQKEDGTKPSTRYKCGIISDDSSSRKLKKRRKQKEVSLKSAYLEDGMKPSTSYKPWTISNGSSRKYFQTLDQLGSENYSSKENGYKTFKEYMQKHCFGKDCFSASELETINEIFTVPPGSYDHSVEDINHSGSEKEVSETPGQKYFFRSQIGKKYLVDYFESGNIRKLYVTVHYREKSSNSTQENCEKSSNSTQENCEKSSISTQANCERSSNQEHNKCAINSEKLITASELLTSFKKCDKQNYEMMAQNKYMNRLFSLFSTEKTDQDKLPSFLPSIQNLSEDNAVIADVNELEAKNKRKAESKKHQAIDSHQLVVTLDSEGETVSSSESEGKESEEDLCILSEYSLDSPDESEKTKMSDIYCVHCYYKFLSVEDNYHHVCTGKPEKGFLCMYCEKIFPKYEMLSSHLKMHLNPE